MFTIPVQNTDGKEIDTLKLDEKIFSDKILNSSVYQVICGYLANQRKGLASTKTRGEVSGGGKKPWKQKGTGRARVGSIRSPLWRHGGVIFGPHPRDFSYKIPVRMKDLALKFALSEKVKENNLIVLDALNSIYLYCYPVVVSTHSSQHYIPRLHQSLLPGSSFRSPFHRRRFQPFSECDRARKRGKQLMLRRDQLV